MPVCLPRFGLYHLFLHISTAPNFLESMWQLSHSSPSSSKILYRWLHRFLFILQYLAYCDLCHVPSYFRLWEHHLYQRLHWFHTPQNLHDISVLWLAIPYCSVFSCWIYLSIFLVHHITCHPDLCALINIFDTFYSAPSVFHAHIQPFITARMRCITILLSHFISLSSLSCCFFVKLQTFMKLLVTRIASVVMALTDFSA